jgi:hypothetical protein
MARRSLVGLFQNPRASVLRWASSSELPTLTPSLLCLRRVPGLENLVNVFFLVDAGIEGRTIQAIRGKLGCSEDWWATTSRNGTTLEGRDELVTPFRQQRN